MTRILFLGDICGKPGREAVVNTVPALRDELGLHFVVANGENVAAGYGISPGIADELLKNGIDCITTGDHFMDRKEIEKHLDSEPRLLRPANYPEGVPGHGFGLYAVGDSKIAVVNLLGRVFLKPSDCPFRTALALTEKLGEQTHLILVDFHAEATAEKLCLGWYLDGRVTAVVGTHTHVPTADERILNQGTAYVTDIGMCGGRDSILGMKRDTAIRRMMLNYPMRLQPDPEQLLLNGLIVEADEQSGRAVAVHRFSRSYVPKPTSAEPESIPGEDGQKK